MAGLIVCFSFMTASHQDAIRADQRGRSAREGRAAGGGQCGVVDTSRYAVGRQRWGRKRISYSLHADPATGRVSAKLSNADVEKAVREAFAAWQKVVPLIFVEMPTDSKEADIVIRFATEDHGDGLRESFDGPYGILAHAYPPPPPALGGLAGDIHLDDAEAWSVRPGGEGIDLVTVLAHEIGHSLGLQHSEVAEALMAPAYCGPRRVLHLDDISAAQDLYGDP